MALLFHSKQDQKAKKGPRDEVDSMKCFETRQKVNSAKVLLTNWFVNILVWSGDQEVKGGGLAARGGQGRHVGGSMWSTTIFDRSFDDL